MKWLRLALIVPASVLSLWILVSLILNQFDEKLDPKFQSLIEKIRVIRPTDGGEIRLGLFWDIPNWREEARDILNQKKPYSDVPKAKLTWKSPKACEQTDFYCSKEQWQSQQEEIQKTLKDSEQVRKRYELLLNAQEYEDPFEKTITGGGYYGFNHSLLRDSFHLSLNQMPTELALNFLIKEGLLLRRYLENHTSLLAKMIDLVAMSKNLNLLNRYLKDNPKLRKNVPANYLSTYQNLDAAQMMTLALEGESVIAASAVDLVQNPLIGMGVPNPNSYWQPSVNRALLFLLQPNATKNSIYRDLQKILENKCWLEANTEICDHLCSEFTKDPPFFQLQNRMGIMLRQILLGKYSGTAKRVQKLIDDINEQL
jgi:hypothetical protein